MTEKSHRERNRKEASAILPDPAGATHADLRPETAKSLIAHESPAGRRDNENEIALWQADAQLGGDDENTGIITRILGTCIESLTYLAQLLDSLPTLRRDQTLLRRCAKLLKLWANGHGAWNGRLNSLLDRSRNLRHTTLSILSPLCKALSSGASSE